jgi:hypothetical protein
MKLLLHLLLLLPGVSAFAQGPQFTVAADGSGANPAKRVPWSHQLTAAKAKLYTRELVLRGWDPTVD